MVVGCTVPSTLGLPCERNEHCDPGQFCAESQVCENGMPMDDGPSGPPTPPPPPPTAPTGGTDGGSTDGGSTSSADSTGSSESTTGPACGTALGTCDDVDVLFVIDNSGSMLDDNATLIPAFGDADSLVGDIVDNLCTYHIGVTTTSIAPNFQPKECQQRGALSRAGALCEDPWPGTPGHPPWVDQDDALTTLGCLFGVGTNYDDDEKQFDTILAALGPELQGEGGCNEGFLREGVPLIVVLITDEDDDDDSDDPNENPERTGSAGGPDEWFDALTAIKPIEELALVVLASENPDTCDPWEPSSGQSDGVGAEYADRILTFVGWFTGAGFTDHVRVVDLCQTGEQIVAELTDIQSLFTALCVE